METTEKSVLKQSKDLKSIIVQCYPLAHAALSGMNDRDQLVVDAIKIQLGASKLDWSGDEAVWEEFLDVGQIYKIIVRLAAERVKEKSNIWLEKKELGREFFLLSFRQRIVTIFKFHYKLSFENISEILDIDVEKVIHEYFRAIDILGPFKDFSQNVEAQ